VNSTGRPYPQLYMGRIVAENGKIKLLRETLDMIKVAKGMFNSFQAGSFTIPQSFLQILNFVEFQANALRRATSPARIGCDQGSRILPPKYISGRISLEFRKAFRYHQGRTADFDQQRWKFQSGETGRLSNSGLNNILRINYFCYIDW
jgi:hypothetical protein